MKVCELKKLLNSYPDDMLVVVSHDQEYMFLEKTEICVIPIATVGHDLHRVFPFNNSRTPMIEVDCLYIG